MGCWHSREVRENASNSSFSEENVIGSANDEGVHDAGESIGNTNDEGVHDDGESIGNANDEGVRDDGESIGNASDEGVHDECESNLVCRVVRCTSCRLNAAIVCLQGRAYQLR